MSCNRRKFLKIALASTAGLATASAIQAEDDSASSHSSAGPHVGCLVDTTLCIGCRQCEDACARRNGLPRPELLVDDHSVFRQERRPSATAFTVVNEYPGHPSPDQAQKENTYVKFQCMHCVDPACVSACIVGALRKAADGSVIYNPSICIGCRYCMVACPFGVPAYEYSEPLKPRVRKCQFCVNQETGTGANPACAASCPMEALVFGDRNELLKIARERIRRKPARYESHIYGEHEVGGTGWLYLTGRPRQEVGMLMLPDAAPPRRTENIQHTIFRYGAIPFAVYGLLGGVMWLNNRSENNKDKKKPPTSRKSSKGDQQ